MKEDLSQFSNFFVGLGLFIFLIGLVLMWSNYEIPFFPLELFWLGAAGIFAVGIIIKFIYRSHEHM